MYARIYNRTGKRGPGQTRKFGNHTYRFNAVVELRSGSGLKSALNNARRAAERRRNEGYNVRVVQGAGWVALYEKPVEVGRKIPPFRPRPKPRPRPIPKDELIPVIPWPVGEGRLSQLVCEYCTGDGCTDCYQTPPQPVSAP